MLRWVALVVLLSASATVAAAGPCKPLKLCGDLAFEAWARGDLAESVKQHTRACDAGYAPSCAALGQVRAQGLEGAKDPAAALRAYQRACKLGSAAGCHNLGVILANGEGVKADPVAARKHLQRACGLGSPTACDAVVQLDGGLQAARPADAGARCDGGDSAACLEVAAALEGTTDAAGTAARRQRACKLGNVRGCVLIAAVDEARAPKRARAAYQRACDAGDPMACGQLGWMFLDGRGGKGDGARAVQYFEAACPEVLEKDRPACAWFLDSAGFMQGLTMFTGEPLDPATVVRPLAFARRACSIDVVDGCTRLASLHDSLRQPAEALKARARACALSDADSCKIGGQRDAARTAVWARCGQGDAGSCEALVAPPAAP